MLTYVFIIFLDTYIYIYIYIATSRCRKDLFRNIKYEIILEVFKLNHLQVYGKEYWRLGNRFTKK